MTKENRGYIWVKPTTNVGTKVPDKTFVPTPAQTAKGVAPSRPVAADIIPAPFTGKE